MGPPHPPLQTFLVVFMSCVQMREKSTVQWKARPNQNKEDDVEENQPRNEEEQDRSSKTVAARRPTRSRRHLLRRSGQLRQACPPSIIAYRQKREANPPRDEND